MGSLHAGDLVEVSRVAVERLMALCHGFHHQHLHLFVGIISTYHLDPPDGPPASPPGWIGLLASCPAASTPGLTSWMSP